MKFFSRLLTTVSLVAAAFAQSTVDSYIASEGPIAKTGLLANIGSSGSKSQGAKVSALFTMMFTLC